MNILQTSRHVLILLFVLSPQILGCAATPKVPESFPERYQPLPGSANLVIQLNSSLAESAENEDSPEERMKQVRKIVMEVFQSSELFQKIGYDLPEADFQIKLEITEKEEEFIMSLESLLFLALAARFTNQFSVESTAVVRDRKGKILGTFTSKSVDQEKNTRYIVFIREGNRTLESKGAEIYQRGIKNILWQMDRERQKLTESFPSP